MGKPTGFMEYGRRAAPERDPEDRTRDFGEFHLHLDEEERRNQGARCMDCGTPFCQSNYGCPVDNLIPEWNDLVYRGKWEEAWKRLMKTNNFPEYTGRVCPAPCESACVLAINEPAVTIKDNECHIIDRAYEHGLMVPRPPSVRTGKRVAIVGSGPAGLAAADQLNKAGHWVTVFERDDRIGGLLMYGIPNMKLDKGLVERRNDLLAAEGIEFRAGVDVGTDVDPAQLQRDYDALLLATGARVPRDLSVPGRELAGVHFAVPYLKAAQERLFAQGHSYAAARKNVVVIGGGDTGADCCGTALRERCTSLTAFELLPRPPAQRTPETPWPAYPRLYRQDYAQAEAERRAGSDPRRYSTLTTEIVGDGAGNVRAVRTVDVRWEKPEYDARPKMTEVPGSEREWRADLVLLAMGFLGPETELISELGIRQDERSNIAAAYGSFATSVPAVFAAGDARRGQSLVVWAINEGRGAARAVDRFLSGRTNLP